MALLAYLTEKLEREAWKGGIMAIALMILAVVTLGLTCGSEFNVVMFVHPTFNENPLPTLVDRPRSDGAYFIKLL
ncbi:MAG TPA: hypothetical protein VHV77_14935 [Pirellulales bacterium]|nr:hypothetical protein [Pirellulales bacterium]